MSDTRPTVTHTTPVCSTCGLAMNLQTAVRNRVGVFVCSEKCAASDQPPKSPTPRTDAVLMMFDRGQYQQTKYVVPADFARTLERELNAARAENERITKIGLVTGNSVADVYQWLRDSQAKRDRLRTALEERTDAYNEGQLENERLRSEVATLREALDNLTAWGMNVPQLLPFDQELEYKKDFMAALGALAAQRAEAFLRTIGKWEEGAP